MAKVTYKSYARHVKDVITQTAMAAMEETAHAEVLIPSLSLVPLDEGPLMDSGSLDKTDKEIYISYGKGESADYAVIQHENLQYAHSPGRQAKYLEMPFRTAVPRIIAAVQNKIKGI